ncbi:hypothetical protein GJ496_009636 [Pomphorhynchus laevis]|nr:hypothetical protein GJ496_009636 [Pomphorhynchus laevis]
MTAATNLASNENVLIVKADKGKQAVLWERDDYIVEAQKHLGSPSYEKCDLNAVKVAVNNVSTLVMKYLGKNVIDKDTANKLEAINSFANARNAFEQMGFRARVALVNASMASQALASPDIIYQADAIKYLEEAVEIATTIKAKYLQIRLHSLYCQLIMKQNLNNDLNVHINAMEILSDQAGLICHYCGNLLGDQIESIEILPCSHIYHYKCVRDGLSKSIKTPQRCIKCSKLYVLNEGMLSLKQIDVFDFIPFNHCRSNSRCCTSTSVFEPFTLTKFLIIESLPNRLQRSCRLVSCKVSSFMLEHSVMRAFVGTRANNSPTASKDCDSTSSDLPVNSDYVFQERY